MEANDENSIDEFAIDLLRRAKERSQLISEKLKHPEQQKEQNIDRIMEKLEKRTSTQSNSSQEEIASETRDSPPRSVKRPILKPVSSNAEDGDVITELPRSIKKTVSTFDAVTGDTIVEAKTFVSDSDDEFSDDEAENVETQDRNDDNFIPVEDIKLDREGQITSNNENETETAKANTTPLLSKTLSKLAEFHATETVDSPVHPHTPLESLSVSNNPNSEDGSEVHVSASKRARNSRLSALAKTINEWEDDTTHHSVPGSRFSEVSSASNRASLAGKSRFSNASPTASSPKNFGIKQGQANGVRLFRKNDNSFDFKLNSNNNCNGMTKEVENFSKSIGDGNINKVKDAGGRDQFSNSDFQQTFLTKLNDLHARDQRLTSPSQTNDGWDETLMKSLELQGFSRKQTSPSKHLGERVVEALSANERNMDVGRSQVQMSPKKTYFGGSLSQTSPSKIPPPPQSPPKISSSSGSSPSKRGYGSPALSNPVKHQQQSPSQSRHSISPTKSPSKQSFLSSPLKSVGRVSEAAPANKPVSAIRMKFEGVSKQQGAAPPKPGRINLKPTPHKTVFGSTSKSPVKRYQFGETAINSPDPSTLSVAERKKLFESSNFCLASKKPVAIEAPAANTNVFTSSPRSDAVKPQDIDISSVSVVPVVPPGQTPKVKRPAPPVPETCVLSSPTKRVAPQPPACNPSLPPPPPPLPSMPNTSTPTNVTSKRRSTSPVRQAMSESRAVKRIKVNAPKPGHMYPSLTDIETETETEVEGHSSEVESMDDSLESQQSLGAEIETIAKACSPIRPAPGSRPQARYRPSEDFSATFACATVDALIDEALEGQDMTTGTIDCSTILEADKTSTPTSDLKHPSSDPSKALSIEHTIQNSGVSSNTSSRSATPEKQGVVQSEMSYSDADTTASSSFTASPVVKSSVPANSCSLPIAVSSVDAEKIAGAVTVVEQKPYACTSNGGSQDESFVHRPLMHTVSFYRKQQQQQRKQENASNLNEISEQPEIDESMEEDSIDKPDLSAMIRKFENEVERCNLAIAQASKALTWCKALVGFSDSTENIECERILLIETQKRLALLNSIHRMKTEGALGQHNSAQVFSPSKQEVTPSCKGNMRVSDIVVTLRRDFFNAHRAECQYHFICLVKNKHQIEHTALLTYESQKQGSTLKFANEFVMQNLDPDFQISLEIYYLESVKEFLPHEAKYRINAKKDSKQATLLLSPLLTPSKKTGRGDHVKPHSPAGPDAVKSSSFKHCGGLTIDISSLQRTYWELDKASGPLTGGINIKIHCSAMGGVEHKGFLTLFEDVSGYGAWVRRWCRLGPAVLEFWKYPEDETEFRKPPLGTLNLHECVTSKVRPAPRDVCARANTLLLVTTRAPHPNDKNTLVTSCHKGYTAVRHLISADTREDRDIWCKRLNKALANLRAWDPIAKQSVDDNVF